MICERCLEDKEKMAFQADDSSYCNICIKQVGLPNLIKPIPSDKRETRQTISSKISSKTTSNLYYLKENQKLVLGKKYA